MIEFLIVVPLFLGMTFLLVRVNTVIQMSIVNQKYGRAQAFFLTYNSPVFPDLFRQGETGASGKPMNSLTMAVTGKAYGGEAPDDIEAAVHNIARPGQDEGSNAARKEPRRRGKIRVRTTMTICSHITRVETNGDFIPPNRMTEGVNYPNGICRSSWDE